MALFNTKTTSFCQKEKIITITYLWKIPIRKDIYSRKPSIDYSLSQGAKTPWADKWLLKSGDFKSEQVRNNKEYTYLQYKHLNEQGFLFNTWEEAVKAQKIILTALHLQN